MGLRGLLGQPDRVLGVACNGMPIASRSGSNTLKQVHVLELCVSIVCHLYMLYLRSFPSIALRISYCAHFHTRLARAD